LRRTQPSRPAPGRPTAYSSTRSGRSSLTGLLTPESAGWFGEIGHRRCARAAESARLEIVCGETHRGFKSHRLRHMSTDPTSAPPAGPSGRWRRGRGLSDDEAMALALDEAAAAMVHGDVPVGAVALVDGQVIAARHNEREKRSDPVAHAEMLVLSDAAAELGTWRLSEVTLVVTLEPCPMCAGALVAARLGRLVFGAADPKAGACGSLYNLCVDPRLNHEVSVTSGVRATEVGEQLRAYFEAGRRGNDGFTAGPS
jgi:tRNA(adenine34) deaminase